ncbi:hypothetical protein FSPOR_3150 [Fusarium sporotrichioides]|uniref:Uncharacterized protein n=1 Tax=Fusarium sporotrichioides TaxID=5514 RepID=A0A395SH40_FUSSP|nr:hypothetical protein FSPOR_3150 [Fusarium sporotrichioides]
MTRALELAWKYVHDQEHVLVYVDDPWIQCEVVDLFTLAGFKAGSYRLSDNEAEKEKILDEWNDQNSDLQVLVADVTAPATAGTMHNCCSKVLILGWFGDSENMFQATGVHGSRNVTFHLLKVSDTYHDHHDGIIIHLGHVFSLVTNLMLHPDQDTKFWKNNAPFLMQECVEMARSLDKAENVERFLAYTPEELRKSSVLGLFRGAVKVTIKNLTDNNEVLLQWRKAQEGVQKRAA